MVDIEEVKEETPPLMPSDERLLDAEEIEKAMTHVHRPTAKLQLESLTKKLRKEAAALKRVEKSHASFGNGSLGTSTQATEAPKVEPVKPAPAAPLNKSSPADPLPAPPAASSVKYTNIDRFSFDPGEYNSKFVTLYVPLPGVGDIARENIECNFSKDSFDLIVSSLKGKSYRMIQANLEKDIDVEKSKYIVKADKIVIKLAKQKTEYGSFDSWSKLTDPKRKEKKKVSKDNPMSSMNDLMKDMYDSGDDKMRKMIGETMLKQRNGELGKDGGMGGMGDFGGDDF